MACRRGEQSDASSEHSGEIRGEMLCVFRADWLTNLRLTYEKLLSLHFILHRLAFKSHKDIKTSDKGGFHLKVFLFIETVVA